MAVSFLVGAIAGFPYSWFSDYCIEKGYMSVILARRMAQFIGNLSVLGPVIISALDNPDMTTIAMILITSIALNGLGMSGYLVHYYSSCSFMTE